MQGLGNSPPSGVETKQVSANQCEATMFSPVAGQVSRKSVSRVTLQYKQTYKAVANDLRINDFRASVYKGFPMQKIRIISRVRNYEDIFYHSSG
jgi:hypothetical protein